MTLAMAPLIVLFELSILLARWIERIKPPEGRSSRWDDDDDDDDGGPGDPRDDDPDDDDPPQGRHEDEESDGRLYLDERAADGRLEDDDGDLELDETEAEDPDRDLTKLGEPDRKD
jgi:sec-independent protein translocase protein TatC